MKRVMIVGQPGSGKSTLARAMGRITGLPVIHVDLMHWKPGWVARDFDEKIAMAHAAEAGEAWIFEGGMSQTWRNRLSRADTLVLLDFSVWFRMWRVFKRTLRDYGRSREDLPDNCPETFDREFWGYIWSTRNSGRTRMLSLMRSAGPEKRVVHLQSVRAVRRFLAKLEKEYEASRA